MHRSNHSSFTETNTTLTAKQQFAVCAYTTTDSTQTLCDLFFYFGTGWVLIVHLLPGLYICIKYVRLRRALEVLHQRENTENKSHIQSKKESQVIYGVRMSEKFLVITVIYNLACIGFSVFGYGFLYDLGKIWSHVGTGSYIISCVTAHYTGVLTLRGGLRLNRLGRDNLDHNDNQKKNKNILRGIIPSIVALLIHVPVGIFLLIWGLLINETFTVGQFFRFLNVVIGLSILITTYFTARTRSRALRTIRVAIAGRRSTQGAPAASQTSAQKKLTKHKVRLIAITSRLSKIGGILAFVVCLYAVFAPEFRTGEQVLIFALVRFFGIEFPPSGPYFTMLRMVKWQEFETYRKGYYAQLLETRGGTSPTDTSQIDSSIITET